MVLHESEVRPSSPPEDHARLAPDSYNLVTSTPSFALQTARFAPPARKCGLLDSRKSLVHAVPVSCAVQTASPPDTSLYHFYYSVPTHLFCVDRAGGEPEVQRLKRRAAREGAAAPASPMELFLRQRKRRRVSWGGLVDGEDSTKGDKSNPVFDSERSK